MDGYSAISLNIQLRFNYRSLLLYSLAALPLKTVLSPAISYTWSLNFVMFTIWQLYPIFYVLYAGFRNGLQPVIFHSFAMCTAIHIFASFARLYMYEGCQRDSYQVLFCVNVVSSSRLIADIYAGFVLASV